MWHLDGHKSQMDSAVLHKQLHNMFADNAGATA
jgi:hypothetical protein